MADVEMIIDSIRVSLMNYQRVVILKEREGERYLPIWIDPNGADSIAVKMQGVHAPRPLTHDFACQAFEALGARVKSVTIDKLKDDTFHAKTVLNTGHKDMKVDCRPSDAIAIAIRVGAPIFADEKVLKKAGIILDSGTGELVEKAPEVGEIGEESSRLQVFSEAAQDVLAQAEGEAKKLGSGFIGTGHLLLGLTKQINTATEVLRNFGIDLTSVPREIEDLFANKSNVEVAESGLTSDLKKTIELSIAEAKRLGSAKVQPEHILIGLSRHNQGIAPILLKKLGVAPEKVYIELIKLYSKPWQEQGPPSN